MRRVRYRWRGAGSPPAHAAIPASALRRRAAGPVARPVERPVAPPGAAGPRSRHRVAGTASLHAVPTAVPTISVSPSNSLHRTPPTPSSYGNSFCTRKSASSRLASDAISDPTKLTYSLCFPQPIAPAKCEWHNKPQ